MDQDERVSPAGLWLAPSTRESPPGGLDVASEIVIRRKGRAESRPGFDRVENFTNLPIRYLDFAAHYLGVALDETRWDTDTVVQTAETSQDLDWDADGINAVESRNNLYLTTADILRKLESDTSVSAKRTGVPTCSVSGTVNSGSGSAIEATSAVSYRVVVLRKDANDLQVRSAPSNRFILTNGGGTSEAVDLTIALHTEWDFQEGDILEIYRSENVPQAVRPLDEHYLAVTYTLTSTDVSNGYVDVTDNTLDVDLGVALYTNDTQQGLAAAHTRPPKAKCCTLFNGSLFLANLQFPPELIFDVSISGSDLGVNAAGVGARSKTATMTNGSAVVTVADTTGLEVGMVVFSDSAGDWAAGSAHPRIISVDSGTQFTLSRDWNSTSAAHFLYCVDSVRIGSNYHPIGLGGKVFTFSVRGVLDQYPGLAIGFTAQAAETDVVVDLLSAETSSTTNNVRSFSLRGLWPDSTAAVVYATHGDAYNPQLPYPNETGLTIPQDILPSGIMWSDSLQPEHFQRENIDLIGHQETPILTLLPLKAGLLIPKADGVWRGSGAGAESGFRFESYNGNIRIVSPYAADVLRDRAYIWADSGVFECDADEGVGISYLSLYPALTPVQRSLGPANPAALGAWVLANRKDGEVLVSVPSTSDPTAGEGLYVYNSHTGTWVNWFLTDRLLCGTYHSADGTLKIQHEDGPTLEERALDALADDVITVSISAFTDTDVTITGGSGWTPAAGDKLTRSGTVMRVMEVASATNFTTDVAPPSTGSSTAEVAISSAIRFINHGERKPGMKVWAEGTVEWEDTRGLTQFETETASSLVPTGLSQTKDLADTPISGSAERPESFRFRVPRRHSRATRLFVKVSVRAAGSPWALGGVSVGYRAVGTRVRKR